MSYIGAADAIEFTEAESEAAFAPPAKHGTPVGTPSSTPAWLPAAAVAGAVVGVLWLIVEESRPHKPKKRGGRAGMWTSTATGSF